MKLDRKEIESDDDDLDSNCIKSGENVKETEAAMMVSLEPELDASASKNIKPPMLDPLPRQNLQKPMVMSRRHAVLRLPNK